MRCNFNFRAEVNTAEQLSNAVQDVDFEYVYAPVTILSDIDITEKDRIIIIPPVFLGGDESKILSELKELKNRGFKSALAHTLGHIGLIKTAGLIPHGGYRLNITNSKAFKLYESLGIADCILSFELKVKQAELLITAEREIPLGIVAYGRLPLMLMRRCFATDGNTCGSVKPCGNKLTDRLGNEFPLLCGNTVEILNPDILILSDKTDDLNKFNFVVLKFTDEKDIKEIKILYKNGEKPDEKFTRGLYYRGVK